MRSRRKTLHGLYVRRKRCEGCGVMFTARTKRRGVYVRFCSKPCSFRGAHNPKWKGADVGYTAAHDRTRRERGPASAQVCPCGEAAAHWAVRRTTPELRESPMGPYSPSPDDYDALCVRCHKHYDKNFP